MISLFSSLFTRYNDDTLESYFSIGLQGLKENDVLVVEDLISSTFKQLAE